MSPARMLSVGLPSTLGSYLTLTKQVFGEGSPACKFIEDKITESPHGADEEVIADEAQVIQLLLHAHKNGYEPAKTCRWCERRIINEDGRWIDPEATGDDSVWRETCDAHDTFTAEHEPS